ncbi:hypothetical protein HYS50_01420 [Candidatus Woesearchaeota archaeon]|nr:hypothetical protein [Candidatus Woesearchaeota archaeon]
MFRELLYVSLALLLFAGILLLFQSFDSPSGSLTGFAVREGQQQTTPLTGNAVVQQQGLVEQTERNQSAQQEAGASAQFHVGVKVVAP